MSQPDERRWTLKVCPECGSIGNGKSSPEFRENCRHEDPDAPGWDIGRNVKRVEVEVMPVQPVERPRDAEAVERVARIIDRAAFHPSKMYEVRVSWGYPGEPDRGMLDTAAISRSAAEEVVAALGPVERPCEVTDEMVGAGQRGSHPDPARQLSSVLVRAVLEAALGATASEQG